MTNKSTAARKPVTRKPKPPNGETAPEQGQAPDQILAVVVPADIYSEMIDALGDLPRNDTKMLWKQLEMLAPQMVNVNRG